MKQGIHPTYYEDALVVCGTCGNTFHTGSTKKEIRIDICSNCHPFFTGEQRIVDTAGQVERFLKRQAAREQPAPEAVAEAKPKRRRKAPAPEAAAEGAQAKPAENRQQRRERMRRETEAAKAAAEAAPAEETTPPAESAT